MEIDRGWAGDSPTFHYQVLVQQFKMSQANGSTTEKLIRGFDTKHPNIGNCEFNVQIALPTSPNMEVEVMQVIYVA
jgi:hypothetical protein